MAVGRKLSTKRLAETAQAGLKEILGRRLLEEFSSGVSISSRVFVLLLALSQFVAIACIFGDLNFDEKWGFNRPRVRTGLHNGTQDS